METKPISKSPEEEIKTSIEQPVSKPKIAFIQMKVGKNCSSLNVRKEPSLKSEILRELKTGTLVNINLEKSTEKFYYVASIIYDETTKVPVHGYSLKEYIHE